MDIKELEVIRVRCEKATPGPWRCGGLDGFKVMGDGYMLCDVASTINADFIAHAREDVPKLIAEIIRLKDKYND